MSDEAGRRLAERIAEIVRREGPIRFDRFQELSLYDPDGGYYERPGRVGRSGDFVTGPAWHPAFGRCLARVARSLLEELGAPISVVDVGAGEGELLASLRDGLADVHGVALVGVERSARRRAAAAERVPEAAFATSLGALPERVRGLVAAYELLDALPVRALRLAEDGRVRERLVALDAAGHFVFSEEDASDGAELLESLSARGARLAPGQLFEIRPGAAALVRALASRLAAGLLLVFDYGAPAAALYGPTRPNGTLEAFADHGVTRDVLAEPGGRDLTAWVDFTEAADAAAAAGLVVRGLVSQSRVLLASGIAERFARAEDDPPLSAAERVERNAIAKLFAPGGMGESIRVLVAERDANVGERLVRLDPV